MADLPDFSRYLDSFVPDWRTNFRSWRAAGGLQSLAEEEASGPQHANKKGTANINRHLNAVLRYQKELELRDDSTDLRFSGDSLRHSRIRRVLVFENVCVRIGKGKRSDHTYDTGSLPRKDGSADGIGPGWGRQEEENAKRLGLPKGSPSDGPVVDPPKVAVQSPTTAEAKLVRGAIEKATERLEGAAADTPGSLESHPKMKRLPLPDVHLEANAHTWTKPGRNPFRPMPRAPLADLAEWSKSPTGVDGTDVSGQRPATSARVHTSSIFQPRGSAAGGGESGYLKKEEKLGQSPRTIQSGTSTVDGRVTNLEDLFADAPTGVDALPNAGGSSNPSATSTLKNARGVAGAATQLPDTEKTLHRNSLTPPASGGSALQSLFSRQQNTPPFLSTGSAKKNTKTPLSELFGEEGNDGSNNITSNVVVPQASIEKKSSENQKTMERRPSLNVLRLRGTAGTGMRVSSMNSSRKRANNRKFDFAKHAQALLQQKGDEFPQVDQKHFEDFLHEQEEKVDRDGYWRRLFGCVVLLLRLISILFLPCFAPDIKEQNLKRITRKKPDASPAPAQYGTSSSNVVSVDAPKVVDTDDPESVSSQPKEGVPSNFPRNKESSPKKKLKRRLPPKTLARQQLIRGVSGYCCGGQAVAVLGPSGAGKTTFLHTLRSMLMDELPPDSNETTGGNTGGRPGEKLDTGSKAGIRKKSSSLPLSCGVELGCGRVTLASFERPENVPGDEAMATNIFQQGCGLPNGEKATVFSRPVGMGIGNKGGNFLTDREDNDDDEWRPIVSFLGRELMVDELLHGRLTPRSILILALRLNNERQRRSSEKVLEREEIAEIRREAERQWAVQSDDIDFEADSPATVSNMQVSSPVIGAASPASFGVPTSPHNKSSPKAGVAVKIGANSANVKTFDPSPVSTFATEMIPTLPNLKTTNTLGLMPSAGSPAVAAISAKPTLFRPTSDLDAVVDELLSALSLSDCADREVDPSSFFAKPGTRTAGEGLSTGERRRVLIALELLTEPHVLLADELTQGLDPALSYQVLYCVTVLARRRRVCLMVSLQTPSYKVLSQLFSNILILDGDGRMVWFGELEDGCKHVAKQTGFEPPLLGNAVEYVFDALAISQYLRRKWQRKKLRQALAAAIRQKRAIVATPNVARCHSMSTSSVVSKKEIAIGLSNRSLTGIVAPLSGTKDTAEKSKVEPSQSSQQYTNNELSDVSPGRVSMGASDVTIGQSPQATDRASNVTEESPGSLKKAVWREKFSLSSVNIIGKRTTGNVLSPQGETTTRVVSLHDIHLEKISNMSAAGASPTWGVFESMTVTMKGLLQKTGLIENDVEEAEDDSLHSGSSSSSSRTLGAMGIMGSLSSIGDDSSWASTGLSTPTMSTRSIVSNTSDFAERSNEGSKDKKVGTSPEQRRSDPTARAEVPSVIAKKQVPGSQREKTGFGSTKDIASRALSVAALNRDGSPVDVSDAFRDSGFDMDLSGMVEYFLANTNPRAAALDGGFEGIASVGLPSPALPSIVDTLDLQLPFPEPAIENEPSEEVVRAPTAIAFPRLVSLQVDSDPVFVASAAVGQIKPAGTVQHVISPKTSPRFDGSHSSKRKHTCPFVTPLQKLGAPDFVFRIVYLKMRSHVRQLVSDCSIFRLVLYRDFSVWWHDPYFKRGVAFYAILQTGWTAATQLSENGPFHEKIEESLKSSSLGGHSVQNLSSDEEYIQQEALASATSSLLSAHIGSIMWAYMLQSFSRHDVALQSLKFEVRSRRLFGIRTWFFVFFVIDFFYCFYTSTIVVLSLVASFGIRKWAALHSDHLGPISPPVAWDMLPRVSLPLLLLYGFLITLLGVATQGIVLIALQKFGFYLGAVGLVWTFLSVWMVWTVRQLGQENESSASSAGSQSLIVGRELISYLLEIPAKDIFPDVPIHFLTPFETLRRGFLFTATEMMEFPNILQVNISASYAMQIIILLIAVSRAAWYSML